MVFEFYLDVNLELFVQWLFEIKISMIMSILCTLKSNNLTENYPFNIIILVVQLLFEANGEY